LRQTELRRVEQFRLDTLSDIAEHCVKHACGTPELEELCGMRLVSREAVARDLVA
jgi:hypothetical protein